MIRRRQIRLALAVALAGFGQPPRAVDAEAVDHLARPAAAVAALLQPRFGGQDAVAAIRLLMALEIGFVAEQAEAVLHLPVDAQRTRGLRLRQIRLREGWLGGGERKNGSGEESRNGA